MKLKHLTREGQQDTFNQNALQAKVSDLNLDLNSVLTDIVPLSVRGTSQKQVEFFRRLIQRPPEPPRPRPQPPHARPLTLYTPSQIDATTSENPLIPAEDLLPMKNTLAWMRTFIMRPHGDLGRPGAVCPFVRASIEKDLLWFVSIRSQEPQLQEVIYQRVLAYKDQFVALPPLDEEMAVYKSIAILLPDLQVPVMADFMEPLHKRLKTALLTEQLMIGQFYPDCMVPGTWNQDFYPLQSPVPMLVIRYLIETDWRFLTGNTQWETSFLKKFGQAGGLAKAPFPR
jgi:hypothetical protein